MFRCWHKNVHFVIRPVLCVWSSLTQLPGNSGNWHVILLGVFNLRRCWVEVASTLTTEKFGILEVGRAKWGRDVMFFLFLITNPLNPWKWTNPNGYIPLKGKIQQQRLPNMIFGLGNDLSFGVSIFQMSFVSLFSFSSIGALRIRKSHSWSSFHKFRVRPPGRVLMGDDVLPTWRSEDCIQQIKKTSYYSTDPGIPAPPGMHEKHEILFGGHVFMSR